MSLPIDKLFQTIREDFYARLGTLDSIDEHTVKILFEQAISTGIKAYVDFLNAKWEKEKAANGSN